MIDEQLGRQERFSVGAYVSACAFTLTSHHTTALILSDMRLQFYLYLPPQLILLDNQTREAIRQPQPFFRHILAIYRSMVSVCHP
jgi:hypothetical protein